VDSTIYSRNMFIMVFRFGFDNYDATSAGSSP
jgi:hypothetical protein